MLQIHIWDFKRQNLDNEYHYEYLGDNEFGGFIHVKAYKILLSNYLCQ